MDSIRMAANGIRRKKTDPRVATYQIDRNINYTNFCTVSLLLRRAVIALLDLDFLDVGRPLRVALEVRGRISKHRSGAAATDMCSVAVSATLPRSFLSTRSQLRPGWASGHDESQIATPAGHRPA